MTDRAGDRRTPGEFGEYGDLGQHAAEFLAQGHDACRVRSARSGATKSITIASANGNNDTNEKKTQPTMYCVVLGLVSEMSLSASGINAPGLASAAGANNRNDRRTGDVAHLRHHALEQSSA